MSSLERLGWNRFFEEQRANIGRRDLLFARVIEEQREIYRAAGEFDGWAGLGGRFRHEASSPADFPAIGDWVGIRGPIGGWDRDERGVPIRLRSGHPDTSPSSGSSRATSKDERSRGVIDVRLDRQSTIARAAAGRAVAPQIIAVNVDTVFVVTALTRDLNPRRLERYVTLVWDAGAIPVVVLNKADLCEAPEQSRVAIGSRLPGVDIITLSALSGEGLEALGPHLWPASTIAMLGSSGVGKSTLVNRLIGEERQQVNGLDADGKGRHTTSSRQLLELPGGALLIDTPGMRELEPWGGASTVDAAFADIAALAVNCRFGDCAHDGEPGCAIATAIDAGRLDPDRLDNYRRLRRELAFEERKRDKSAAAAAKRQLKRMMQAQKALYRQRERS